MARLKAQSDASLEGLLLGLSAYVNLNDALYTHQFANEKVALHAKEIVEYMGKNSPSLLTVCVCDLDFQKQHHNQITKEL